MKQTSFLRLQKNIGMTRITSHVIDYIETMGQKKIIQTKILHGEVFTILTFDLSTGSKSLTQSRLGQEIHVKHFSFFRLLCLQNTSFETSIIKTRGCFHKL